MIRNGNWVVVWSQFSGGKADDSGAQFTGIESSNEGRSWSCPGVVSNEARLNTMSASLLRMQDGDLGLIFAGTHAFNDLKFYLWRSPDEGKS